MYSTHDDSDDSDDFTARLKNVKQSYDRACEQTDNDRRCYLEDPSALTKRQFLRSKREQDAAYTAYIELCEEFDEGEDEE